MAEILLPPDIVPETEQVELVDDGTQLFVPQFAQSAVQAAQYFEPYVKVTQTFKSLRLSDRGRMMSILGTLQGKYNTLRALVGYSNFRGSFGASELVSNPTLANSTNGFSATNGTISAIDNVLRNTFNGGAVSSFYNGYTNPLTVVQSSAYAARAYMRPGQGLSGNLAGLLLGSALGSGAYLSVSTTGAGLRQGLYVPSSTSAYLTLQSAVSSGAAGSFFDTQWNSLSRAMAVDSGTYTGNSINVCAAPSSLSGALRIGDMISIGGELKLLTAQFDTNSAGKGYLQFSPALFRAVSSGDLVTVFQPMGKFKLVENPKWSNQYGQYADLTLVMRHIYE